MPKTFLHPREAGSICTRAVMIVTSKLCVNVARADDDISGSVVVTLGVVTDMLLAASTSGSKFIAKEAYAVADVSADATIGRVPRIGGEVTAIGLGPVMTASDVAALAPLEESFFRC